MSLTSRYDLNIKSSRKDSEYNIFHNMYVGEVISNQDELDMGRIKVRTFIDDKFNIANENLPFATPLQSKLFHIIPKVGEIVQIFLFDIDKPFSMRFWMGPAISQPQFYKQEFKLSALNNTNYRISNPSIAPSKIENAKGIYPEVEDVAILGRDNNDIILKDKQITLRVGKHLVNDELRLNRNNPGYINLRLSEDGEQTNIMTVANKIGLMSHNGKRKFKTILDEQEIERFFNESHPMLKGDLTLEVLKKIINAIIYHVHGGSGLPPAATNPINELLRLDLDRILSENIRIN
jgi:hypothetical protein